MTSGERKLYGITLQLVGAAMATGGIVFLSCIVGTVIPLQINPQSMIVVYALTGAAMVVGLLIIGIGAGLFEQGATPHCLRCEFEFEAQEAGVACPRCGFVPLRHWPNAE